MKMILFTAISFALFAWVVDSTYNKGQIEPWKAPASTKKLINPNSGSSSIKSGKSIFKDRCVQCHGNLGNGNTTAGKKLIPKTADLTTTKIQNQTDGEIFWKITTGRGPMVEWRTILRPSARWDLVNYIRTLEKH